MGIDRNFLIKAAGLSVGVVLGGVLGPVVFVPAGLNDPSSSSLGAFIGAVLGFALASAIVVARRRRRDRELEFAANSVLREAGLPASITAKVKDSRVTLMGEVDEYSQRQTADRVVSTVPGIAGVSNQIRLRGAGGLSTDAIKRTIEEALQHDAELNARGIKVRVEHSRIVLEGTVQSWAESSEAEEIAWNVPGIEQVENRLQIAA
ncbi:MAG: transport-associated protein [Candidatus Solibacter sp.]|jgi:hypothetical protein|nr:transport-associated protein [Candidatus Solibacter sp.]